MLHKLQGAETMGHPFEIVALSVREVIHGISIPLVAGTQMRDIHHPVEQRISEEHVRMSHIYLGSEHQSARSGLTAVHELKESQVLLHGPVTEGAVGTSLCGGALLLGYHFGTLFVHISSALANEPYSEIPQLLEIVTSIINMIPLEPQPANVILYTLYVFCVLLHRIGIIKAKVASASILLGYAEIKGNRLGMSYVKISIRLGWETCLYTSSILTLSQILFHLLFNEVQALLLFILTFDNCFCHVTSFYIYYFVTKLA